MIFKGAKPVIGKYDVIVTTVFNRKSNKNFVKMHLPFFTVCGSVRKVYNITLKFNIYTTIQKFGVRFIFKRN